MTDSRHHLVARIHLARRARLSAHFAAATGYGSRTREILSACDGYPDYVWLIELSLPMIYGTKAKVGEVILDPHADETDAVLRVHLPGLIWSKPNTLEYAEGDGLTPLLQDPLSDWTP
jgi:hypothetical protein